MISKMISDLLILCCAEVSNEEVFADVYHSLIHSAGLSATLLQLEHSNAAVVGEKCGERRREVAAMHAR